MVGRTARRARTSANRRTGHLIVTIDGPGGVGKSTTAKRLAQRLGIAYLDTGATYRALALAALQRGLHPIADADPICRLARALPLRFAIDEEGLTRILLGGVDVTGAIRTEEVTEAAAQVSQHPAVREAMVALQRRLADGRSVVVEGRDTGSVVFPRAPHKFFLSASGAIRAKRRQLELGRLYGSRPPLVQVTEQLHFRDNLDRTRRVGPLIRPRGSIAIDTSRRTVAQVVETMLRHIQHQKAGEG